MDKKKENNILDLDAMGTEQTPVTAKIKYNSNHDLVEEYNSCILCGAELLFVHLTDFCDEVVFEESSCPNCNIKSKKKAHRLQ